MKVMEDGVRNNIYTLIILMIFSIYFRQNQLEI